MADSDIAAHVLEDDGSIPNSKLPLLVYRTAVKLTGGDPASVFEELFEKNRWHGTWRNGIYSYHHYHSTAHEVLGVYRGHASIRLGDSAGVTIVAEKGDVLILPAGTAHQNLGASADFHVVGGYPKGQSADLLRGTKGERPAADERIARVALPVGDPISGTTGPLVEHWKIPTKS